MPKWNRYALFTWTCQEHFGDICKRTSHCELWNRLNIWCTESRAWFECIQAHWNNIHGVTLITCTYQNIIQYIILAKHQRSKVVFSIFLLSPCQKRMVIFLWPQFVLDCTILHVVPVILSMLRRWTWLPIWSPAHLPRNTSGSVGVSVPFFF